MAFARAVAVIGLVVLGWQVLALVGGRRRPGGRGSGGRGPVRPTVPDEVGRRSAAARTLLWRAGAAVLLLRLVLLLLVALTPAGALLLLPLSRVGVGLAYPVTLLALALVAGVPGLLVRRWRQEAYRLAPELRPQARTGRAARAWWLRQALLAVAVAGLCSSVATGAGFRTDVVLVGCLTLAAVVGAVERARTGGPAGVAPDTVLFAGEGVDRLVVARDSLTLPPVIRTLPLLVGRAYGQPAMAVPARDGHGDGDGGGWSLVVAPELLAWFGDRQLRALLARELGRLQRPIRRRQLLAVGWQISAAGLAWWLPQAFWGPLTDRVGTAADRSPAYQLSLLAALTIAVAYGAHCLLRPLVLWALRADEAAVDALMVTATGDPQGCAEFLEELGRRWGTPRRWSPLELLLTANHPGLDERVAAVTALPAATAR